MSFNPEMELMQPFGPTNWPPSPAIDNGADDTELDTELDAELDNALGSADDAEPVNELVRAGSWGSALNRGGDLYLKEL